MNAQLAEGGPLVRPSGLVRVRGILALVAFVAALSALVTPAAGEPTYTPSTTSIVTSTTAPVVPGGTIILTLSGFMAGSNVDFFIGGTISASFKSATAETPTVVDAVYQPDGAIRPRVVQTMSIAGGTLIGSAIADGQGVATFEWRVPADYPIGPVTIAAAGIGPDGKPLVMTTTVTITSSSAGGTGGGGSGVIPVTGTNTTVPLLRVGFVVLGVGALVTVLARRRMKALAGARPASVGHGDLT